MSDDINPKIDLEIATANGNALLQRLSGTPYYVVMAAFHLIWNPGDESGANLYGGHELTSTELLQAEALASEFLYSIPDTTKAVLNYATLKASSVILELLDSKDAKIRLRAASLFLNSFTKAHRASEEPITPINNQILFVNGGNTDDWGVKRGEIILEPKKK